MARTKYLAPRIAEKYKPVIDKAHAELISRATEWESDSFSAAVKQLIAEGLKYIMCFHSDYPINRGFMDAMKPDGLFDLYKQFEDAIASDDGRIGVLEGRYRFELTPEGSEFFDPNSDSYMILHQKEIMDENGEIYYKREI